ncbi:MAG: heme-binding protein [Gemmatimonadetes bacterium]|nr:MAG: heme-binding protein [Gemmatimonadota bacterium]
MKALLRIMVVLLGLGFIGIQFVPVERTNPVVRADLEAPPGVKSIFKTSCYDCHSHETVWPWYSKIAPVSWLVARDVNHGREYLNFSEWGLMDAEEQIDLAEEIWEEVAEGKMPLAIYLPLHPDAKLNDSQKETIKTWSMRLHEAGIKPPANTGVKQTGSLTVTLQQEDSKEDPDEHEKHHNELD